jgi:hypothetical protein
MIMTILAIGTLTVFSHAVSVNAGNSLREQAQSVLQQEAEYYRSLKFLSAGSDADLAAGTATRPQRTSPDGKITFNISVTVTNLYPTAGASDTVATFKQITISATPAVTQTGWLSNLKTDLTIQRVRSN